ncbi:DUF1415 domain-containing protein [Massilia sp. W12]|uniref:DUF1415 domain-containing protein n=1 Tax=Massilia sp. W12 TaxID=3126507 RepID=UPI0030D60232
MHWLQQVVIGLNLCPFAKAPVQKNLLRLRLCAARTAEDLLHALHAELTLLQQTPLAELETTLLIHPGVLQDFYDYNDFLSVADDLLARMDLEGVLQIASFHPDYQFADSAPQDIENCTNRSPWPCLHLLREESLDRAVQAFPEAQTIWRKNQQTMRELGGQGWRDLQTAPVPWPAK